VDPAARGPEILGGQTADALIRNQAGSGMPADRMAAAHDDTASWLFSEAGTPAGQAFARGYSDTARTLIDELHEMEADGPVPVPPNTAHPDPRMAAKGWQTWEHESRTPHYVRRDPAPSREAEREAG
jgi:hypothetical protein